MRATLPNPDGRLVDGQLVQVSVEGDKPEERIVVPQAALIADQQGIYVFIVEDGKAAIRRVKVGQTVGGSIIVTEGLNGGELVATTGLQGLRPGLPCWLYRPNSRSAADAMFSSIFVDRPRLAVVIALVTAIAGLVSLLAIPIAQFPNIVPPQVR